MLLYYFLGGRLGFFWVVSFGECVLYHEAWIPLKDYEALLNHHWGFISAVRVGLASIYRHHHCLFGDLAIVGHSAARVNFFVLFRGV